MCESQLKTKALKIRKQLIHLEYLRNPYAGPRSRETSNRAEGLKIRTPKKCPEMKESTKINESIPRQIDKKSRVPKEEKGVWGSQRRDNGLEFSRRRKGQTFFFPPLHSLA